MSLTEVAHLNREQLLQREKQLQSQLAQQRVRPPLPPGSSNSSTVRFTHRVQQTHGTYRCSFVGRGVSPLAPKPNGIPHPVSSVRHSLNRVFVRKQRSSTATSDTSVIPQVPQGRLSPAGSLASVASSVSSLREAQDEMPSSSSLVPSPQNLPVSTTEPILEQISPALTPTPADDPPSWARAVPTLVVPIGDHSSDDSDEGEDVVVRAHSEALRRILHPVKEVKQPASQSIVFQTATKLVKHGALQRPAIAAVLKAAAEASARHTRFGDREIKSILANHSSTSISSHAVKTKKFNNRHATQMINHNHHHHLHKNSQINSYSSSISSLSSNSTSGKTHPTAGRIASTGSSGGRQQQQQQLSKLSLASTGEASISVLPYIGSASTSSPRKTRHASKFKLTSLPNRRSAEFMASVSSSKLTVLKRHSTTGHGMPSTHRIFVKASPTNPKKLITQQTRFRFTRGTDESSNSKTSHVGVHAATMPIASGRIMKKGSTRLQKLLMLGGVPFQTSKGGKVLKRINTTLHRKGQSTGAVCSNPMQRSIRRLKTSLMASGSVRQGAGRSTSESVVKHAVASHLVNRSILKLNNKKRLETTSSPSSQKGPKEAKDCLFYIRFGKCHKGDACKFTHDPAKVSICTRFLKGTCKSSTCPFSHEISADRMPLCSYFQRGQCTAQACPYRHVYFRKDVPYCEDFLNSFCTRGEKCTKQHVLVCTDPECSRDPKKCPLRHKKSKSKDQPSGKTSQRRRKRKKVILVAKSTSAEAWPEFVTLTGDHDVSVVDDPAEETFEEVQVEMPSRGQSHRLKHFLERRARPVWPDYSLGISATRLEARQLTCLPGYRLRQLMKKARWMRRVPRPVRIPGEFISLEVTNDQACDSDNDYRRKEMPARFSEKSMKARSWPELSGDEVSDSENEMLLEFTYGDAITLARRREGSVASEVSVSSYTSPESDYSSHDENSADADKRPTSARDEENDWLLEYLYSLEKSPSPVPEPDRLDNYGPIYEHWEFQIGDKIREAIQRFKRRRRRHLRREERKRSVPLTAPKKEVIAEDYIPLWAQEEGEILSEDEVEGVDLDVVDMELDSDEEDGTQGMLRGSPMEAEEISSDEDALAVASEDEANDGRSRLTQAVHINGAEAISDVEDISDVEEGEVF